MKYCRFNYEGLARYGEVLGGEVAILEGPPWLKPPPGRVRIPLTSVELLPPTDASKVVAVGQNYRKHAAEMGKPIPEEPLIFLKPASALNGAGRAIELPPASQEVHHEAELGLVIGRDIRNIDEGQALSAIFALTCVNDVTARDIQRREVQHTRSKSYDTFACVGPWMVTDVSPADLGISCRVNGAVRQQARTSDMIFPPARLVAFMSRIMTLKAGDIISTGTPSGVGPLVHGDVVEVEIEGIGTLSNPVVRGS